ncbi:MAG: hypothetical protein WAT39_21485, partial [Planctomycetota bacterium]
QGRVLATVPHGDAFRVRVACDEQLVVASAAQPLPAGSLATLALTGAPRLLPWQRHEGGAP